ncbi:hypothetical protein PI125_g6902 [Phytophthora idaei]|nr:hypothetical protein PI125_g6902 [Phytophthora idaei]
MAGSAPTMNTTVYRIRSNGEQLDAIDVELGPEHDMSSGDEAETPQRVPDSVAARLATPAAITILDSEDPWQSSAASLQ